MPAKPKTKKLQSKSGRKLSFGPETTLRGLEKFLEREIGGSESGIVLGDVGGKKTGKNTKLKNVWEGFSKAAWPKKSKK